MIDTYAAHKNRKTGETESVRHHLEAVSGRAQKFAVKIGASQTAYTLGKGHDIAKLSERFQKVLNGEMFKVNHAAPGAAVTWHTLKTQGKLDDRLAGCILYNLIKAHHEGLLSNYCFDEELFFYEFKEEFMTWLGDYSHVDHAGKVNALGSAEETLAVCKEAGEYLKDCTVDAKMFEELSQGSNIKKMMFIRMLFSCLVDADYTSSAEAMDGTDIRDDYSPLDAETLLEKLAGYRDNIVKDAKPTPINKLRNYVYECAKNSGSTAVPGMYTMTAPTGLAKTFAMIRWGLESARKNRQDRIFIILPFLSIIDQNVRILKGMFGEDIVIEDDSVADLSEENRLLAERWNARIIVTTNVKFYETLFSYKPTALRKLHNIANSVVIFDEAQSLPPEVADITENTLFELAGYNTSVLSATATPPAYEFRTGIPEYAIRTAEVIPDPQALYDAYSKARKIDVRFDHRRYTPAEICRMFADKNQALYVVNTKNKAYAIYAELKKEHGSSNVFILTTDLCPANRLYIINKTKTLLKEGKKIHLVSTQCIEAGVDVDFPCGLREFGPLTSVIQAIGRIGREGLGAPQVLVCNIECGKTAFPTQQYGNETRITEYVVKNFEENKEGFSINSLGSIKAYYKELFSGDGSESQDKKELREALGKMDFEGLSNNYNIIDDKNAVNVIVPYKRMEELYENLSMDIRGNGFCISKKQMRAARPVTISVYSTNTDILNQCEQLNHRCGPDTYPTNWYLMPRGTGYIDDLGLQKQEGGIFL